ncbi:MAG: hypothetical protein R2815_00215 [Flavobacteriales bacterium]
MKRSAKRARIGPSTLLVGVAVPLGLLAGVVVLTSPHRLTGKWPIGIQPEEVRTYARWKGLLTEPERTRTADVYQLNGGAGACVLDGDGGRWHRTWFEADGYGDHVQVRSGEDGAIAIAFGSATPFRTQHRIDLVPATVRSIRAKYIEVLATELGLPVPEVSFVRVIACGRDLGIHLKQEAIDRTFLTKRRLTDATLFRAGIDASCPQGMFPEAVDDTLRNAELRSTWTALYAGLMQEGVDEGAGPLDREATIAWLLMRWLEDGDHRLCATVPYALRRSTGTVMPLFERSEGTGKGDRMMATADPMTAMLRDASVVAGLKAKREELNEVRWRMKERFAAIDQAWLPILAEEGDLVWARAIASRMADELLDARLAKGDPVAYHARRWAAPPGLATFIDAGPLLATTPVAVEGAVPLERLSARFRSARIDGDTLFFGRGKYEIDEEIILPAGKALVIEKGARLYMGPASGLMVQGPLSVRGTSLNPVFIRAVDDARPFKGIAVRGNGSAPCALSGLKMSGGGDGAALLRFEGASSVNLDRCELRSAQDGVLTMVGGSLSMASSELAGNGTLLTLDQVRATVVSTSFIGTASGIVLSGGRALFDRASLQGFNGAALKAGQAAQVLVLDTRFERNATAIEAVDLATVHVSGVSFDNNALVFALRREDPIQGGGHVVTYNNAFVGNAREREVDAYSTIDQQAALDPKLRSDMGAEEVNP